MSATTTTGSAYSTAPADISRDRSAILALWSDGLTQNGVPAQKFDWYYLRNPQGQPLVMFLYKGNERIGVASVGPRRVRLGDQTSTAGVLVDFVVKTAHRNFFAAITLQQEVQRRASAAHSVLLALPNPQSLAVLRRLGYRELGLMERRVRVLKPGAYLAKHLPGWLGNSVAALADGALRASRSLGGVAARRFRSEWLARPDARFDALWQRASKGHLAMTVRDQDFLAWRFVDCPINPCRFFTLLDGDDVVGYAACAPREQSLKIFDFLADTSVPGTLSGLLLALSREAQASGYHSLTVEHFGDDATRMGLGAAGFVVRKTRPIYGGGRALEDPAAIGHMTCADEDW